jgi:hypothetical protein
LEEQAQDSHFKMSIGATIAHDSRYLVDDCDDTESEDEDDAETNEEDLDQL